jgi:glycoprotein endo-alpha-1,2-mannosidase
MKKFLIVPLFLLLVSCTVKVQDKGILGTWIYTVEEAPFGFQTGRVIFYEENDSVKAKLKVYGIPIETDNLEIDSTKISFTTQVEHEEVSIKLEKKEDMLVGLTYASEGSMAISMVKKGRKNREQKEKSSRKRIKSRHGDISTGRALLNQYVEGRSEDGAVNYKVHTFYYGWYSNPEYDGNYGAWNHSVLPHWIDTTWNNMPSHTGGDDVGANFYPQLGNYSSKDPATISTHVQQIKEAGIGVIALSWWGKESGTDHSVSTMLDTAYAHGLKVTFHIEPIYKTADEFRELMEYISSSYLQHPAIYKIDGKPLYYLYNSFQLKHEEWQSLLNPDSTSSLRNTPLDGVFIGLWTTGFDGEFAVKSGFDGFYTYFASDGFAYGSTTSNWPDMAAFARENNLIYIPSVGPGYADTRIRPWNEKTTKSRDQGRYYEEMFKNAVNTTPDFISITSFNEWHEGTQIEPVIPKEIPSFTYLDYGEDTDPMFYIWKTKSLIDLYFND